MPLVARGLVLKEREDVTQKLIQIRRDLVACPSQKKCGRRGKREEGRGKREEGRGKREREEGRGDEKRDTERKKARRRGRTRKEGELSYSV
jgi:hypothetical protein